MEFIMESGVLIRPFIFVTNCRWSFCFYKNKQKKQQTGYESDKNRNVYVFLFFNNALILIINNHAIKMRVIIQSILSQIIQRERYY